MPEERKPFGRLGPEKPLKQFVFVDFPCPLDARVLAGNACEHMSQGFYSGLVSMIMSSRGLVSVQGGCQKQTWKLQCLCILHAQIHGLRTTAQ